MMFWRKETTLLLFFTIFLIYFIMDSGGKPAKSSFPFLKLPWANSDQQVEDDLHHAYYNRDDRKISSRGYHSHHHGGHHSHGGHGHGGHHHQAYTSHHDNGNLDLYSLLGGLSFASLLGATIIYLARRNTNNTMGRKRRSLDPNHFIDDGEDSREDLFLDNIPEKIENFTANENSIINATSSSKIKDRNAASAEEEENVYFVEKKLTNFGWLDIIKYFLN